MKESVRGTLTINRPANMFKPRQVLQPSTTDIDIEANIHVAANLDI